MSTYYYLKNLRAQEAHTILNPESCVSLPTFASKSEYRTFCSTSSTDHYFISLNEGLRAGARISTDNPIFKCHGFVADYDAKPNWDTIDADIKSRSKNCPQPTWIYETQSSGARLIWEFETAICVDAASYDRFIAGIAKLVNAKALLAGFDESSLVAGQYFEVGKNWRKFASPIAETETVATLFRSAKPPAAEISIPFETVSEAVIEKFGHRVKTFAIGERVPLFWIEDGVERLGGQVFENGVVCYSDRAGKAFCGWSEILGHDFVKKYEDKQIGEAVNNFYYDGKTYWGVCLDNIVRTYNRENLVLRLKQAGFSMKTPKGKAISPLENAMLYINENNRIDSAGPFLFRSARVFKYDGKVVLNTARPTCVEPAAISDVSRWPFLNQFFNALFDPIETGDQLDYFFAWFQRSYKACYERRKLSGQAMILVGDTGKGKTLLGRQILAPAFGGRAEAAAYLLGQSNFNKQLAESPLWVVDDLVAGVNFNGHRIFTEMIKRAVANPEMEYQAKFQDAGMIEWCGRVYVTTNEDANSLAVIPTKDSSNADKLIALRLNPDNRLEFPPNSELEEVIAAELPYFLKWLTEWKAPDYVTGKSRFGVRHYFHPIIENAARDNSARQQVLELLDLFAKSYREYDTTKRDVWTGTLAQLASTMRELPQLSGSGALRHEDRFRNDMRAAADAHRQHPEQIRPITNISTGSGSIWSISLLPQYDL